MNWVPAALFPGLKRSGLGGGGEPGHLPQTNGEVKNSWNHTSITLYISVCDH
jgi:hypothetical protein